MADKPDVYAGLNDRQRLDAKRAQYLVRMHALQSGVAQELSLDKSSGSPKHLRVGVNSLLLNQAALVRMLVARGLFTEEEYTDAILAELETEIASYERGLSEKFGTKITLG